MPRSPWRDLLSFVAAYATAHAGAGAIDVFWFDRWDPALGGAVGSYQMSLLLVGVVLVPLAAAGYGFSRLVVALPPEYRDTRTSWATAAASGILTVLIGTVFSHATWDLDWRTPAGELASSASRSWYLGGAFVTSLCVTLGVLVCLRSRRPTAAGRVAAADARP